MEAYCLQEETERADNQQVNEAIEREMRECRLCARNCGIDRTRFPGRCGMTAEIRAARAALHMWEEPCISGKEGSGAIFFTGCPIGCIFCQNRDIALGKAGKAISIHRLAEIMLELQDKGANNINLVTPTQYVPQIIEAVRMARGGLMTKEQAELDEEHTVRAGRLRIPVLYNTGSLETPDTVRKLEGTVDIFLPDLKYFSTELAEKYSGSVDYFKTAAAAIREMVRITGACEFDERGIMKRGTLVRHLILPGHTEDSKKILSYLHETYGDQIYISIMNQYTPMPGIEKRFPELGRRVTRREYDKVVDFAIDIGIENAYIQEGGTQKESFIPAFDYEGL
jgi:putative pyruvate formate lyase activating enzyme